jgi:hypothetical protein
MTEGREIRASHEEVEGFVSRLRHFHASLDEGERTMMDTILDSAQGGETGGYRVSRRPGDDARAWQELVDWLEEQGEEDAQGFNFYHETWRQRPEDLRQEAERTRLMGRLRKARRERNRSPEDTSHDS